MKAKLTTLTLASIAICLCFASCKKTPGQKLDNAIDTANAKAKDAKEAVEEKYLKTKRSLKAESDEVRKEAADKISP